MEFYQTDRSCSDTVLALSSRVSKITFVRGNLNRFDENIKGQPIDLALFIHIKGIVNLIEIFISVRVSVQMLEWINKSWQICVTFFTTIHLS